MEQFWLGVIVGATLVNLFWAFYKSKWLFEIEDLKKELKESKKFMSKNGDKNGA